MSIFKKGLSVALSAAMAVSLFPVYAADSESVDVGTVWKFDFGSDTQTAAEGYYSVTPSTEYNANSVDGFKFGLYGQNKNDYKLGNYEDGVTMKKGQVYSYTAAGTEETADSDRIGIGELPEGQIDGLYPIRFSMDAENNSYYKVKVNITTLDDTKEATGVNVYSEKRHAIVTSRTISAGEVVSVEFTATPQNVLVKDRANGGTISYNDKKLNVEVVGSNAAISSIEVEKTEPTTTVWCYDDSTGCDYPMTLPFFAPQNFGGTAQYLSKYLGDNVALVNQGDGGINAGSTSYFNTCKNNIKAGDYIYLQYGHNHKYDGPAGYVQYLKTYYTWAHEKGAYMVYVGPIDRHNEGQYDASTNTWSSTLSGFSKAAKYYTELLICGGTELADQFAAKAKAVGGKNITDDIYAWADEQIANGITDAGVNDAAFVDLNAPTVKWLSEICEEVRKVKGADSYKSTYSDYYFRSVKGGKVDGAHENDLGADATASFFFDGIEELANKERSSVEEVEYNVLKPLLESKRDAAWDHVSDEVVLAGAAPNDAYPDVYMSSDVAEYPTAIKSIEWNEDGTIGSVNILKQESQMTMSQYGMLELNIYDQAGKLKGSINSTQVDNVWSDGTSTSFSLTDETNKLTGDTDTVYSKADGDTFTAVIYKALDDGNGLKFDESTGKKEQYSEFYAPTDVLKALVPNEDGEETEDFNFYGVAYDGSESIHGKNGWQINGSADKKTALHQEADGNDTRCYVEAGVGNASTSYAMSRKLAENVTGGSGRISISVDLRANGTNTPGNIRLGLGDKITTWPGTQYIIEVDRSGKVYAYGNSTDPVATLNADTWTSVNAVLDMDLGTITVTSGDKTAVSVAEAYTTASTELPTYSTFHIGLYEGKEGSSQISNLKVLKLTPSDTLPEYTVSAAANNSEYGAVECSTTGNQINSIVTVKAEPKGNMKFVNWKDADGNIVSTDAEYKFRLRKDTALTAYFGCAAVVNAVDDNGTVLKKIAETQGVPGEEYSVGSLPQAIEKDGIYYELTSDGSQNTYKRSFTMGNGGDEVQNITYKRNGKMIYFAEGENAAVSNAKNVASDTNEAIYSGGEAKRGNKTDAYLKFESIKVPETGTYTITFAGNNTNGKSRTTEVFIDTVDVGTATAAKEFTTAANKSEICSFEAELSAGEHYIVLNTQYSITPLIDYLYVEAANDIAPTLAPVATASPKATNAPVLTASPEATKAPAPSASAEATKAPAPSASAEATKAPAPDEPIISTNLTVSDGVYRITANAGAVNGYMIAAAYKDDVLTAVDIAQYDGEDTVLELTPSAAPEEIKVMLWKDMTDIQPLCPSVSVTNLAD